MRSILIKRVKVTEFQVCILKLNIGLTLRTHPKISYSGCKENCHEGIMLTCRTCIQFAKPMNSHAPKF